MDRINFENLPSTNTPINAENLNQLQANIEGEIENRNKYTTGEQKIGTWINGKPLYRKVIETTMPTVTTNGTYAENKKVNFATNVEFAKAEMYMIVGDQRQMLPYVNNSGHFAKGFIIGNDLVLTANGTGFSDDNVLAIIEYTKTTD